jgi:hypothetical protein
VPERLDHLLLLRRGRLPHDEPMARRVMEGTSKILSTTGARLA